MTVTNQRRLSKGFTEARNITRTWAKSFYFASLFLPREKRYASYAVYAMCRACDCSVDNTPDASKPQNLKKIQEKIDWVYTDAPLHQDLDLAFRETVGKYKIPKKYFDDLIDGMRMDLDQTRYDHFGRLVVYCYKVAGVVGLIMLRVLEYRQPEAKDYAVDLGIAMQLTNILRDIKEDYALGRIYLPEDEMIRHHINEGTIASADINNDFKALMKCQIERARKFYQNAVLGIPMINGARCRFVVWVMLDIYANILTAIEKNSYDVFTHRAHVPTPRKIFLALRILLQGRYWQRSTLPSPPESSPQQYVKTQ